MARVGLLHGIHAQATDRVDRESVEVDVDGFHEDP
jgi:hypothetical protein